MPAAEARGWADPKPFDLDRLGIGAQQLGHLYRKAARKSQGDMPKARGRLLLYKRRDPAMEREMVRQAIWKAMFAVALDGEVPPPAVPLDRPPHPFKADEVAGMLRLVQTEADAALRAADGELGAARLAMWRRAGETPELAAALSGLMILAQS